MAQSIGVVCSTPPCDGCLDFTMESPGMRYGRRRCKSEGLEADSAYYGRFEQSYAAETKRPLSRWLPQVARPAAEQLRQQEEKLCSPYKVRLPSPGRRPFQSVNATDLQYFSGSLPNEWSGQPHLASNTAYSPLQERWNEGKNQLSNNHWNDNCVNGYSSHSCCRKYQNGFSHLQGTGDMLPRKRCNLNTSQFHLNGSRAEENYLREVEALRSKLDGLERLHGAAEGKRVRQRSESDAGSANTSPPDLRFSHCVTKEVKRAREQRTLPRSTSPSACPMEKPIGVENTKSQRKEKCDPPGISVHHSELDTPSSSIASEESALAGTGSDSGTSFSSGTNHKKIVENNTDGGVLTSESKQKKIREYPGPHSLDGLRPSLFSHVPPYISFSLHDQKGPAPPPAIQRLLKWNLSTITPLVVRRTVVNSGYRLIRKSNEWTATWGKHMKCLNFKVLKEYQKINHFPGTFQIGRKDRLWKNLFRFITKFGKKEFGFIPRTFVLPQDTKLLRSAWERSSSREAWIVKPPASARGTGIKVIHRWGQIPKKRPLVVQKYIDRPYLINGCKFDLRLYILVTSFHPLRVYMYDDGLVRFASVKYSEDPATLTDRYMHLTNYSINKLSSHYTHNEDESACKGHKWSVKALWRYLERKGIDVAALWERLLDLAIKTVISGESSINQLTRAHLNSRYCCYELFGLDVLFDQDLKPWLLEVNISPSLHSSSPLDLAVKGPMVRDVMNMAGHQVPSKLSPAQQEEVSRQFNRPELHTLCMDKRMYTVTLSTEERGKHILHQQANSREEYLTTILNDLTADDVRHLIQYEDELTQCGRFQKIFPTPYTHEYHQFFESPRYYNMLLDAWENKFFNNRQEGIGRLEELCQRKLHLQVPIPSARAKDGFDPELDGSYDPELEGEIIPKLEGLLYEPAEYGSRDASPSGSGQL